MGNERILIPSENKGSEADLHLCIFPFFVKDADATLRLKGSRSGGSCIGEVGMYPYRDGVLFADPHQVPYPGGCYYDTENTQNDYARLCFLTRRLDSVSEVYADWYGKRNVLFFPFQTRVAELRLVSDFLPTPTPVSNICFPSTHLKSSGSIHKRLSQHDPHMLLQDVLNTYASANAASRQSNPLDNIALFVEYPFVSGFENNCGGQGGCVIDSYYSGGSSSCSFAAPTPSDRQQPKYVPFLVNGLNPKTVIQVKHPYDRYVEYQKIDTERILKSDWSVFLYERYHAELLPSDVGLVRIENTLLGYKYRGVFLCLSYPMLADSVAENGQDDSATEETTPRNGDEDTCDRTGTVRNSSNHNTDCLLNAVESFDPKLDRRLSVTGTYGYDDIYDIYQVKHVQLRNELWCLVDKKKIESLQECHTGDKGKALKRVRFEDDDSNGEKRGEAKFFRKAAAPLTKFVYEWIDFFYKNADKKDVVYGDVDVFRLAMVLARHKICLALNLANSRKVRLRGREYVFDLDRPAIDFINDMRLSTATTTETVEKEEEGNCVVM